MKNIITTLIILFCLFYLFILKLKTERLTNMFVVIRRRVYQKFSSIGKKEIKTFKKSLKSKDIKTKMYHLSKFLINDLKQAVCKLDTEKEYKTHTHLKSQFEKAQSMGLIKIISIEKEHSRSIIAEAFHFLGFKDIIKILFSKDRAILTRKFYTIKFIRTVL